MYDPRWDDSENRRVPFDAQGRLAPVLKRRPMLGPSAFAFGGPDGEYKESFKTAGSRSASEGPPEAGHSRRLGFPQFQRWPATNCQSFVNRGRKCGL